MKHENSIRFKLLFLVVVPLIIVTIVYIFLSFVISNKLISDNTINVIDSVQNTVNEISEEWRNSTLGFAGISAANASEELLAAFSAKDAEAVAKLSEKVFESTHCDGMTFTDMEGNAISRVTNPAKFGDNIKTSSAIADALEGKSVAYAYPTANNGFSIAAGVPLLDNNDLQIGVVFLSKRLDKPQFIDQLKAMTSCDIELYQKEQLVSSSLKEVNLEDGEVLSPEIWDKIYSGEHVDDNSTVDGNAALVRYIPIFGRDNEVVGAVKAIFYYPDSAWVMILWIIVFALTVIILCPLVIREVTKFVKPIQALTESAKQLSMGNVNVQIINDRSDEIGILQNTFIDLAETSKAQAAVLERLSRGDLTVTYSPRSEYDSVGNSLISLIKSNKDIISNISSATSQVSDAANHVADGGQNLAEGAAQQTEAISTISREIDDIGSKTDENTKLANKATQVSAESQKLMSDSLESMSNLVKAMDEIVEASGNISKVIKVIDEIAFQTNILALNASVEAARAGQHGKGFAVVAGEVRSLAAKSADATSETSVIIEGNIEKVNHGGKIVEEASVSLRKLAENFQSINDIISTISKVSESQNESLKEIKLGVENVSQIVNSNSSAAESSAAASEEMSGQAGLLKELVNNYKLY